MRIKVDSAERIGMSDCTSGTLGQERSLGGMGQLPSDGVNGKVW